MGLYSFRALGAVILDRLMHGASYADLADSATNFDPEEQFDRDIDKALKDRIANELQSVSDSNGTFDDMAKAVLKMIRRGN
jgi:hypothetical protein